MCGRYLKRSISPPCGPRKSESVPVDTGALAPAREEASKCPRLPQARVLNSRSFRREDRGLHGIEPGPARPCSLIQGSGSAHTTWTLVSIPRAVPDKAAGLVLPSRGRHRRQTTLRKMDSPGQEPGFAKQVQVEPGFHPLLQQTLLISSSYLSGFYEYRVLPGVPVQLPTPSWYHHRECGVTTGQSASQRTETTQDSQGEHGQALSHSSAHRHGEGGSPWSLPQGQQSSESPTSLHHSPLFPGHTRHLPLHTQELGTPETSGPGSPSLGQRPGWWY